MSESRVRLEYSGDASRLLAGARQTDCRLELLSARREVRRLRGENASLRGRRRSQLAAAAAAGAFVMALVLALVANPHAAPAPTDRNPTPQMRTIGKLRERDRTVRMRKCLPPRSYRWAVREIPAGHRHYVLHEHLVSLRLDLSAYERCPDTWLEAVRWAQGPYPGTAGWLLFCSRTGSEGGWGRWFWNGGYPLDRYPTRPAGSSGAGGWLQFMRSTFYRYVDDALAEARRRGFWIPPGTRSWFSPLGQALTGAYMLRIGQSGQWEGHGCN